MRNIILFVFLVLISHSSYAYQTKSYQDYSEECEKVLLDVESNYGDGIELVKVIAAAFATLHLNNSDFLWWPGMASIAQSEFVGFLTKLDFAAPAISKAAVTTIKEVFRTGYVPLYIYINYGINEVRRLAKLHPKFMGEDFLKGAELIDKGRLEFLEFGPTKRSQKLLREGNAILIAREHVVLQKNFYGLDFGIQGRLFNRALSVGAVANFSDSSLHAESFFLYAKSLSAFKKLKPRTLWNTEKLLPSFIKFRNIPKTKKRLQEIAAIGI